MEKYKMPCDLCGKQPAKYDGKTTLGCWAFLCEQCFKESGVALGLGRGQRIQEVVK